ncbi:hypothetical protein [Geminocystis herdmanii]|uniref:hypothetical protein n=1 Tax=Geminocystis herdmanii TaxID=669359 RepID=UPI00034D3191|nr:hypothetical protein [Geminocystis herdmanii]
MEIITNRLKINFNIDNIKNDFIFLRFTRTDNNSKWWGAKVLDYLLGDEYKALAVSYTGEYAFAMLKKEENNGYDLVQKIRNYDDNLQKFIVNEVQPKDIINNDGEENIIDREALARLLLNYLGSSTSRFSNFQFSNLTGCLLKVPHLNSNKLNNSIQVGEVNLNHINNTDNEFLLNVSMATYRLKSDILSEVKNAKDERKKQLQKYLNRPDYEICEAKNILKRYLGVKDKNDPKKTYIKAGIYRKKAHQDFLKFKNIKDFESSRLGILIIVINDIQKKLNKYLNIEFIPLKIDKCLEFNSENLMLKDAKKLHFILDNQKINIVDLVKDEISEKLVNDIQELLNPYFKETKLISLNDQEIKGIFNLRIIHDKNYYKKNNIEDKYLLSDDITPRQNLTIESVKKLSKAIIKTLIKELIIKQDISRKKISLFDWNNIVQSHKKWIFGMYKENDEENKDNSILTFMTINADGSFVFENLDTDECLFNEHKYQDYHDYIEEAIKKEQKSKSSFKFEGFVMSENGDINLIFCSDEITLPPLEKLESLLKDIEKKLPENLKNPAKIIQIVDDFLKINPNLKKEKFEDFRKVIKNNYNFDGVSKKELYNLIQQYLGSQRNNKGKISYTANTDEATKFRDYLLEKYQVRFIFPKDNETLDSLFANTLNINYFGETDSEAYYFVGDRTENTQHSFKDACHIRKIIAVKGCKLIFQDLLKTMDVDFVRTGQSTVLPFPFKYIREYLNLTT